MRERLLELVPEFELIEDKDLREKTISVWRLEVFRFVP